MTEPDSARPRISLRGLRKTFGTVTAVDGVDLDIADGEFFAMLGPSGSGKTTVLRMIAGFETPTSGRVILGGEDQTNAPPARRDVATVFQDYALFPHMSVAENVGYGLRVRRVPAPERGQRVREALEMVRLGEYGRRRPAELSGGQRQRVALARALVTRPRVLLLDEPLGALDLKLREQMQVELKGIQREIGITFVFVTHDQDEALTLSDRLAVFTGGRIEQVGPPAEVYERPATPFVAGFVGSSNILSGSAARSVLGREGLWSVRPEKIRVLSSPEAAERSEGTMSGTIAEVVYAGPTTRVVVSGLETSLSATLLNDRAAFPQALTRGAPVTLAWPRDAVRRLDAAPES